MDSRWFLLQREEELWPKGAPRDRTGCLSRLHHHSQGQQSGLKRRPSLGGVRAVREAFKEEADHSAVRVGQGWRGLCLLKTVPEG